MPKQFTVEEISELLSKLRGGWEYCEHYHDLYPQSEHVWFGVSGDKIIYNEFSREFRYESRGVHLAENDNMQAHIDNIAYALHLDVK